MALTSNRVDFDGVSDAHKKAVAEARELVAHLEDRFPHQPLRVQGEQAKMSEKIDPLPENVHKMRVLELAHAYHHVSDGNGGIASDAHKTAIQRMNSTLRGQNHASPGFLPSERAGKAGGLPVRAAAGLVITLSAGIAAAAEPDATPRTVFNKAALAAADSQLPGFTAFSEGKICKGVGELTGATASGAVAAGGIAVGSAAVIYTGGLAGTLIGGVAAKATMDASAATYNLTAPAAEAGCHATIQALRKMTQKIGL